MFMVYKLKSGFILRKIGNQIMAVPVGSQTSHIHGMIALTESGALLWDALIDGTDEDTLSELLIQNYEVDKPTALSDVRSFLRGLKEQGAL
jgi:hypothetical protein